MITHSPNQEIRKIAYRSQLVVLLWALILAKCFTLEFLVDFYSVPIDSVVYVWSLSIFMAVVASFVFLRVEAEDGITLPRQPTIVWGLAAIGILLLSAVSLLTPVLPTASLPAAIALVIGCACLAHGLAVRDRLQSATAFGWWLGAAVLFRLSGSVGLLLFAFLLVALVAVPIAVRLVLIRRRLGAQ